MAWTTPISWDFGLLADQTHFNAHVRDNLLETSPAKLTTKGDLMVTTAANTVTRLAVGTDNQLLVADSALTPGVGWKTMRARSMLAGHGASQQVPALSAARAGFGYVGIDTAVADFRTDIILATPGTLRNFRVFFRGANSDGILSAAILSEAFGPTGITVQIAAGSSGDQIISDTTNTYAAVAGEVFTISLSNSGTGASAQIAGFSVEVAATLTT